MRILLIHQYFLLDGEGGGGRWNEITRRWVQQGDEVVVVTGSKHYLKSSKTAKHHQWYSESINKDGVKIVQCTISQATFSNNFFLVRMLEYVSFLVGVAVYGIFLHKQKVDCLIATSPPLTVGVVAIIISWWKKCPYVAEVRDLWPESAIEMGVLSNPILIKGAYLLEKWYYQFARAIVVLTPAFKDHLYNYKKVDLAKLHYVPNAVDFRMADQVHSTVNTSLLRETLQLTDQFVVVYVGAHGKANGLDNLLYRAKECEDLAICFLCIGDGQDKLALQVLAEELELTNVRFLDLVDKQQVLAYVQMADVGLTILQKQDIFKTIYSNKTFDYFSCRKPVLMAVDGISRQLVEDAQAGLYVDSTDSASWRQALATYYYNQALRLKHGENGYQYAKQHFDRDYWAAFYRQIILNQVINNG